MAKNDTIEVEGTILEVLPGYKFKVELSNKHIIEAHDEYEMLLEKTGEKNGFLDAEYEYIKDLYAERQRKNDFL